MHEQFIQNIADPALLFILSWPIAFKIDSTLKVVLILGTWYPFHYVRIVQWNI